MFIGSRGFEYIMCENETESFPHVDFHAPAYLQCLYNHSRELRDLRRTRFTLPHTRAHAETSLCNIKKNQTDSIFLRALQQILSSPAGCDLPLQNSQSPSHVYFAAANNLSQVRTGSLPTATPSKLLILQRSTCAHRQTPTHRHARIRAMFHFSLPILQDVLETRPAVQCHANQRNEIYFHSFALSLTDIRFSDGDEGQQKEGGEACHLND